MLLLEYQQDQQKVSIMFSSALIPLVLSAVQY